MPKKKYQVDITDQMTFDTPDRLLMDTLILTHEAVLGAFQEMLGGYDVSYTQYCILTILAQEGPEGMRTQKLGARLLTRVPDITRLIDRLLRDKLVQRIRSEQDKRVVFVSITPTGAELLQEIKEPAEELRHQLFQNLTEPQQIQLNNLLHQLRPL